VKNITVSVDDEVYRKARIRAAEAETSVSALVRDYLIQLAGRENSNARLRDLQDRTLKKIKKFRADDRLDRDKVHEKVMHFLDTNVLLYALSTEPGEARKAERGPFHLNGHCGPVAVALSL
jgi:plasmid stability protein